jgi:hypothetical protein
VAASRAEIDLVELEKLCGLQCTDEEIAAWFNVSVRTIERRRQEPEFSEVMHRGRARGRISVRRMQMKLLEQGNASMGIWLGKQLLGQRDNVVVEPILHPQQSMAELREKLGEYLRDCPEIMQELRLIDAEYRAQPAPHDAPEDGDKCLDKGQDGTGKAKTDLLAHGTRGIVTGA